MDGEAWGLSLSQFTQLSPKEQVLLLVPEGVSPSEGAAATAQRVAKLMAVTVQPEQRQQLLVGLVQEDAPRHLPWCVHMFERLRLQRQVRIVFPIPSAPKTQADICIVCINPLSLCLCWPSRGQQRTQ